MADREDELVVGAFYWAMPVLDPDREFDWEFFPQPVRFVGRDNDGNPLWQCINLSGVSDWPMRYIGERLIEPTSEEKRLLVANNDPDGNQVLFGERIEG